MPAKKNAKGKRAGLVMGSNTQHKRLRSSLRRAIGMPVDIIITNNTYTMISYTKQAGRCCLRLHHMFLSIGTTSDIVKALAIYITDNTSTKEKRKESKTLDDFIAANRPLIRSLPPLKRKSRDRLVSQGRCYNLKVILAEVVSMIRALGLNVDAKNVAIGWSPTRTVKLPRRVIKLGSYSVDSWTILIHPALDSDFVPRYFIQYIVFHELIHHHLRADLLKHVRIIHTAAFSELEQRCPCYQMAIIWEKRHSDRLLWWKPKKK